MWYGERILKPKQVPQILRGLSIHSGDNYKISFEDCHSNYWYVKLGGWLVGGSPKKVMDWSTDEEFSKFKFFGISENSEPICEEKVHCHHMLTSTTFAITLSLTVGCRLERDLLRRTRLVKHAVCTIWYHFSRWVKSSHFHGLPFHKASIANGVTELVRNWWYVLDSCSSWNFDYILVVLLPSMAGSWYIHLC